jgi:putative membrane protein
MISRYSDHAANERTFLAWVRTAIAVMAFGFLVEKFDLFLEVASRSLAAQPPPTLVNSIVGDGAGLLLILLGGSMMVVATIRFRQIGQDIDATESRPGRGSRMDMALVGLLLALGSTLFVYLLYTVVRRLSPM